MNAVVMLVPTAQEQSYQRSVELAERAKDTAAHVEAINQSLTAAFSNVTAEDMNSAALRALLGGEAKLTIPNPKYYPPSSKHAMTTPPLGADFLSANQGFKGLKKELEATYPTLTITPDNRIGNIVLHDYSFTIALRRS